MEADLEREYGIDLIDFYRGKVSARKLDTLVRGLSAKSRTATAINGGIEVWSRVEHLLADIWVLLVQANSEKGSLPDDFDHPERAKVAAAAKAQRMKEKRAVFLERKRRYEGGVQ